MYTTICELVLDNGKRIEFECLASGFKHGKLMYFINFDKIALKHRPPHHSTMSRIRRLCSASSSSSSLASRNNAKALIEWRNSKVFQKLDATNMIVLWKDILWNSDRSSIDSNTLHLKENTVFIKLEGFHALCRVIFNADEYARLVISMMNVMSIIQQRHFNRSLNARLIELGNKISELDETMKRFYMENCELHRQLRMWKSLYRKKSTNK